MHHSAKERPSPSGAEDNKEPRQASCQRRWHNSRRLAESQQAHGEAQFT